MRVLFAHSNFPAQYRHVATALAAAGHQVVFATTNPKGELKGVAKRLFKAHREVRKETHSYVRPLEFAVLNGQATYRLAKTLRAEGFVPDVVCAHSGWGAGQFFKDAFPEARLIGLFEWYYHAWGSDASFLKDSGQSEDDVLRIRAKNAPILLDLVAADLRLSPTEWQRAQFPESFRESIRVQHEGIDTAYFSPLEGARLKLPNLDLSGAEEIMTFVSRGMEPYRDFPEMIRATALLQRRRPGLHVVVVGADRVAYGRRLADGRTYKQKMLEETPELDLDRLHFTGLLPYGQYREVIRASSLHLYLTVPFVLSWSMLECMATGCLVLGSDTEPVREVIEDGVNGLLVDFHDVEAIAEAADAALSAPEAWTALRARARETIVERYDLARLLPRQLALIEAAASSP